MRYSCLQGWSSSCWIFLFLTDTFESPPPPMGIQPPVESSRIITWARTSTTELPLKKRRNLKYSHRSIMQKFDNPNISINRTQVCKPMLLITVLLIYSSINQTQAWQCMCLDYRASTVRTIFDFNFVHKNCIYNSCLFALTRSTDLVAPSVSSLDDFLLNLLTNVLTRSRPMVRLTEVSTVLVMVQIKHTPD